MGYYKNFSGKTEDGTQVSMHWVNHEQFGHCIWEDDYVFRMNFIKWALTKPEALDASDLADRVDTFMLLAGDNLTEEDMKGEVWQKMVEMADNRLFEVVERYW